MESGKPRSRAEGVVAAIEARLFPVLRAISEEPHMAAIRDAMGPSFIGLVVVTLVAFFIPPEPRLHEGYTALSDRFFAAYHIGFGAMGVVLTALLGWRLARGFSLNRYVAVGLSLAAFFSALRWPAHARIDTELGNISATSILLALVVTLIVVEILRIAAGRLGRTWWSLPCGAVVTTVLFGALWASGISLADVLLVVIRPLVSVGDTLPALLIIVFLQTLLWTAGVHGPAFLSGIVTPVFLKALDENVQAVLAHQSPPHIVTFMLTVFYFPGGSGATLSLSLLMLRSRVTRLRKLALASLLPSLINVNELLIFGVPLVMNPSLTIPFLAAPVVMAALTYVLMYVHLVGRTVSWVPSPVPAPIAAWLTTLDWRAVVLVAVNVLIGFALYGPFLRAYERSCLAEPAAQDRLLEAAKELREHERELIAHPERSVHAKDGAAADQRTSSPT